MLKNFLIFILLLNLSFFIYIYKHFSDLEENIAFDVIKARKQFFIEVRDFYLKGCEDGMTIKEDGRYIVQPGEFGYNNPVQMCLKKFDAELREDIDLISKTIGERQCFDRKGFVK